MKISSLYKKNTKLVVVILIAIILFFSVVNASNDLSNDLENFTYEQSISQGKITNNTKTNSNAIINSNTITNSNAIT